MALCRCGAPAKPNAYGESCDAWPLCERPTPTTSNEEEAVVDIDRTPHVVKALREQGTYEGDNLPSLAQPIRDLVAAGWQVQYTRFDIASEREVYVSSDDIEGIVGLLLGTCDGGKAELLLSGGQHFTTPQYVHPGYLTLTVERLGTWSITDDSFEPSDGDDEEEDEDEEQTCRTCGEKYPDAGDGWDGECPSCADKTARAESGDEDDDEADEADDEKEA